MIDCPVTITGFHQDEEGHWVAELSCGHGQHMRHLPPWQNRPWVMSVAGRNSMLGQALNCRQCETEILEMSNIQSDSDA
ncbi:MAG: DUF3565 domain-containing protein [Thiohalophilus sp.]